MASRYATALILSQVSLALDSGMIVIIFIVVLLLTLLFTMFSSVDNNWCNLLFPNGTVSYNKTKHFRLRRSTWLPNDLRHNSAQNFWAQKMKIVSSRQVWTRRTDICIVDIEHIYCHPIIFENLHLLHMLHCCIVFNLYWTFSIWIYINLFFVFFVCVFLCYCFVPHPAFIHNSICVPIW